jgi:hypothetical protein
MRELEPPMSRWLKDSFFAPLPSCYLRGEVFHKNPTISTEINSQTSQRVEILSFNSYETDTYNILWGQ